MSIKRPIIRPQAVLVGVIGTGNYAKLVIERLLQMQHQVITPRKELYDAVLE